jgi:hypothetical protein
MLVADATTKLTTLDFYIKMRLCLQGYSSSSECAGKYSRIRNSIRSRCRATQKCWLGLRWPAGLAHSRWPLDGLRQVAGIPHEIRAISVIYSQAVAT